MNDVVQYLKIKNDIWQEPDDKPPAGFEELYTRARAFMSWLINDMVHDMEKRDDTWQEPVQSEIWEDVRSKVAFIF